MRQEIKPEDLIVTEQDGTRRAGEAELRQRMNSERHVACDNEGTDDAGNDGDDHSRRYRVLGEVVAQQMHDLVDHGRAPERR